MPSLREPREAYVEVGLTNPDSCDPAPARTRRAVPSVSCVSWLVSVVSCGDAFLDSFRWKLRGEPCQVGRRSL